MATIRNNQTGEVRTVDDSQLGNFGINPQDLQKFQAPSAPTDSTSQSPDLATSLGQGAFDLLKNIIAPISKFVQERGGDLQKATTGQKVGQAALSAINPLANILNKPQGGFDPQGARAAAQAASFAVPFNPAEAGLVAGAVLPGAVAGGLQGASQEGATPQSIAGNSILGGVGGGAFGALGKVLGGAGEAVGGKLENMGNSVLRSQYALSPTEATALKLNQAVPEIADLGFSNINKVAEAAPKITGADGIITRLTREAVGNANPVETGVIKTAQGKTPGILSMAEQFMKDPNVGNTAEKKFLDVVTTGLKNINGMNGANPSETFGFIQDLERQAAQLTKSRAMTPESEALARGYKGIASELKDRLFLNSGADNSVVNIANRPDVLKAAGDISPQLADKLKGAKTVGDLRGIAAPFVKASQAAEITANKVGNKVLSPTDLLAGGIGAVGAGGPGAIAGVGLEKALNSTTGKSVIGNILRGAGNAAGNMGALDNPVLQGILAKGGATLPPVMSQTGNNTNNPANNTPNNGNTQFTPPTPSIPQGGVQPITADQVALAYRVMPPQMAARVKSAYDAQQLALGPQTISNLVQSTKSLADQAKGVGPIGSHAQDLARVLGVGVDPNTTQLNANLSTLRGMISLEFVKRGISSPEAMKQLNDILPTSRTSLADLKQKLDSLPGALGTILKSYGVTLPTTSGQ
jgi:hypothetical protein